MSVPNPLSPQVLLGLWGWDCAGGVCVPGVGIFDAGPSGPGKSGTVSKPKWSCEAQADAASKQDFDAAKKAIPNKYKSIGAGVLGTAVSVGTKAAAGSRIGGWWGAATLGIAAAASPWYESATAYLWGSINYSLAYQGCTEANYSYVPSPF
jgi:hypothetical protein